MYCFVLFSQDCLNNKGFGQDLPSVENEVEEHNIFHSEVEALAPHVSANGDKVNVKMNNDPLILSSIKMSIVYQCKTIMLKTQKCCTAL